MARIDDLVSQVPDKTLRDQLVSALADVKKQQQFGLVFEDHIPESTALLGYPVQSGAVVTRRDDPTAKTQYCVLAVSPEGEATVEPVNGGPPEVFPVGRLMVVKRFGEPIYPALTPLGATRRGPDDKPSHAVINAENFHALQMLLFLYEGQADCIYLDPPYNTGARDWKYNNQYVDSNDGYRHSKWLSYMEKRLRLAKRLLKPDGVLIVTIDEHEVNHLGMLLEKEFPGYLRYMITIVISARGNYKANFARVEEYGFFCCPQVGRDVINGTKIEILSGNEEIDVDLDAEQDEEDDLEGYVKGDAEEAADEAVENTTDPILFEDMEKSQEQEYYESRHARRRGPDSHRSKRATMFYPIFINEAFKEVVRAGEPIPLDMEPDMSCVDGLRPIWPIDAEGEHRRWRWGYARMVKAIANKKVKLGKYNSKLDSWTINVLIQKQIETQGFKKIKTVWRHTSHDAGTYGTSLIAKFLSKSGLFPFPKSLYAVRDCLAAVVLDRPDALIIDTFAGSGTTLHATCLLNAADQGRRRCVLVTNNEVKAEEAESLNKQNLWLGDAAYEAQGIFEQVTRPRCEAAITGHRADGKPVQGKYIDGRPYSEGFPENVEFFRLDYLDPDDVELGTQFKAIQPALWLAAGGIGPGEPEPTGAGADGSRSRREPEPTGAGADGSRSRREPEPTGAGADGSRSRREPEPTGAGADGSRSRREPEPTGAGADGSRSRREPEPFIFPEGSNYGVLFYESRFKAFQKALETRPDVAHVWLVTDSETAFAEMNSALPRRLKVGMLYRDYLRNFQINTERGRR